MPTAEGSHSWFFAECRNPACRYRFPVEATQLPGLLCPLCGGALLATTASSGGDRAVQPEAPAIDVRGLLDNIRSIHNTGSMFRTADGAGLAHLYLCGITPTPEHPRLAKAALGAETTVRWSHHRNAADLAADLVAGGFQLWALERLTADQPAALPPLAPTGARIVLVVGNERAGIDPAVLRLCHRIVSLPMSGRKGSLNAAVAFGIGVYALRFGRSAPLDTPIDSA